MAQERYLVQFTEAAERDLMRSRRRFPQTFDEIGAVHVSRLEADPWSTTEPLRGDLADYRSYHFGRRPEWRMIVRIIQRVVLVIALGPHDEGYRRAKNRV